MQWLVQRRFDPSVDRQAFDMEVRAVVGAPMPSKAAEWLRNLLEYAIMETTLLGSTTVAVATVIGNKMAYVNVGDCAVIVFRKMSLLQTYTQVYQTPEQHITVVDDATGTSWVAPRQVSVYDPASRCEAARLSVKVANFNAMKVEEDDVVIVCSDGITDNLNKEDMRNIIEAGMHQSLGPQDFARELVEFAIGTNRKPDDTCAFVGIVTKTY